MKRIGDEVRNELARAGGGTGLALTEITAVWEASVGEAVARQAWPLRMGRDGTLHVATSSSTWAFELDRLGPEISGRLEAALGDAAPRKLRFAPGPLPEPDRPAPQPPGPPAVAPAVAAEANAAASAIGDAQLRELVARAARASLARARSGRHF